MAIPHDMRIGQLTAELALSTKTIRFYDNVGLLPLPRRSPTGYRIYGTEDVSRLRFVLKAKQIGLSLEKPFCNCEEHLSWAGYIEHDKKHGVATFLME